jgi:hypothetical protein
VSCLRGTDLFGIEVLQRRRSKLVVILMNDFPLGNADWSARDYPLASPEYRISVSQVSSRFLGGRPQIACSALRRVERIRIQSFHAVTQSTTGRTPLSHQGRTLSSKVAISSVTAPRTQSKLSSTNTSTRTNNSTKINSKWKRSKDPQTMKDIAAAAAQILMIAARSNVTRPVPLSSR